MKMWSKSRARSNRSILALGPSPVPYGDHGEAYAVTTESLEGFDRTGDQLRSLDYADAGRVQVLPSDSVALRVRPVPVACPHDLAEQVIGYQSRDSGRPIGTHLAPAHIHPGKVDDSVVEVDEHCLGCIQRLSHPPRMDLAMRHPWQVPP